MQLKVIDADLAAMLNDPKIIGRSLPRCLRCGRVLKDQKSIKRKIGPECLKQENAESMEGFEGFEEGKE